MDTQRQPDSSTVRSAAPSDLPLPPEAVGRGVPLRARVLSAGARTALALALVASLIFTSDGLNLNPAQQAASPHLYSLVQWEAGNFLDKWLHRASSVLPWNSISSAEREEMISDYFALSAARTEVAERLENAVPRGATTFEIAVLEARLAALDRSRQRIQADVEEALEAAISSVLVEAGLSSVGGLIFPPVDFRLTLTPHVLVTSPRDRIERGDEALLRPGITISDSLSLERELLDERNLSALVIRIGGLASYPASVFGGRELRWTLQVAAHEWLHHHLFFRPLGFGIMASDQMRTINETVANVAGREIGDLAYARLGGEIPELEHSVSPNPVASNPHFADAAGAGSFDFHEEMHATRLHVDELLAEGRTQAAEAYMDRRRLQFVENGYNIRKLNQAYFAFHGTYADSAASVSPIGDQVQEYRNLSPGLGSFVSRMSSLGSYEDFLADLALLRAAAR